MDEEEWAGDWLRAALPLIVLARLACGEVHGYALLQSLGEMKFRVKGSTLYPLLTRQQDAGRVEHRWEHDSTGPARKIYRLTVLGHADLERLLESWTRFQGAVTAAAGIQRPIDLSPRTQLEQM